MLAGRLLSILMLLQTRGRISARELAAEFEVAVRTIHRDIDQLSAAGIPVYAERGRSGGFRLQDGYRTKLTGLNPSEAETLFLAGLPGPAAQLGLADALATARLKLLAALPPALQPGAERIAARFHLDHRHVVPSRRSAAVVAGHRARGVERAHPETALPARGRNRSAPAPARAARSRAESRRLVPRRAERKRGAHVSRGEHPRRRGHRRDVPPPKHFDLAAHWEKAVREYEAGVYHEHADVRLSPQGVYMLDMLGPYVQREAARHRGQTRSPRLGALPAAARIDRVTASAS